MQLGDIIVHAARAQARIALALAARVLAVRRGDAGRVEHCNRIQRGHLLSDTYLSIVCITVGPPLQAAGVAAGTVGARGGARLGGCGGAGGQVGHDDVVGPGGELHADAEPAREVGLEGFLICVAVLRLLAGLRHNAVVGLDLREEALCLVEVAREGFAPFFGAVGVVVHLGVGVSGGGGRGNEETRTYAVPAIMTP